VCPLLSPLYSHVWRISRSSPLLLACMSHLLSLIQFLAILFHIYTYSKPHSQARLYFSFSHVASAPSLKLVCISSLMCMLILTITLLSFKHALGPSHFNHYSYSSYIPLLFPLSYAHPLKNYVHLLSCHACNPTRGFTLLFLFSCACIPSPT
jgi:hypothetical protein